MLKKFPILSLTKKQFQFKQTAHFSSEFTRFNCKDLIVSFTSETERVHIRKLYRTGGITALLQEYESKKRKGEKISPTIYKEIMHYLQLERNINKNSSIPEKMDKIFDEMVSQNIPIEDATVIQAMYAQSLLPSLKYLEYLKNNKPSLLHFGYAHLIRRCAKLGKLEKAEELFEEARKENTKEPVLYSAMLKAYSMANRSADIERLIKLIKQENVEVNADIYSALIYFYSLEKKFDKVNNLYTTMRQKNFKISIGSYKMIVKAFVNLGDVNGLLNLISDIKQVSIIPLLGDILKISHCSIGVSAANQLFRLLVPNVRIERGNETIDYFLLILEHYRSLGYVSLDVYSSVITYAARIDRFQVAFSLIEQLTSDGVKLNTELCNSILFWLKNFDHNKEFEIFLNKMKEYGIPFDSQTESIIKKEKVLQRYTNK